MKLILLTLVALLLSTSQSQAAKHEYDCTDWVVNGGGSGSCSGETITFTATDNYVTDGTYHAAINSGFTISNGTTYYITWETNTGTYNNAGLRITNSTAESSRYAFTFGAGAKQTSISGISGANAQLMWDNNGGGGAGSVTSVCISDVSYNDCLGIVEGSGSTSTLATYDDWILSEMWQVFLLSFVPIGLFAGLFKPKT